MRPASPDTVPAMRRAAAAGALVAALGAAFAAPPAVGGAAGASEAPGDEERRPPLALTARLAPSPAGPETLLRLSIDVDNRGEQAVSALRFAVAAEGREIPVYRDTVFLAAIAPGERRTVPLHNLWTSEGGRPPPADGRLDVEVTLLEASWVARETTADGVVWRIVGPVPDLPLHATATVDIVSNPR